MNKLSRGFSDSLKMKIKINFTDFWPGFNDNNLFLKFLEKHFDISLVENPDYLFYSVYGTSHFKYKNCIKILYTGENLVPDFNLCDYALGFHFLQFGDRYMRFPLHVYYRWYYQLKGYIESNEEALNVDSSMSLANRKFCNFIYSNYVNSDPTRDYFYKKLSLYKKVDSGGRHLNNIGIAVPDKLKFIRDYKFTIAFENSLAPGYTTEKLIEPLIVNSLPIYYGNPDVETEFNSGSFIHLTNISEFEKVIENVIYLDKNDDKYIEKLHLSRYKPENALEIWEDKLFSFFNNIFGQPIESAFRRSAYGYNKYYNEEMKLQAELMNKNKYSDSVKNKIKIIIRKINPGSKS